MVLTALLWGGLACGGEELKFADAEFSEGSDADTETALAEDVDADTVLLDTATTSDVGTSETADADEPSICSVGLIAGTAPTRFRLTGRQLPKDPR